MGLRWQSRTEAVVQAYVLGLCCLILFVLSLGIARLLYPAAVLVFVIPGAFLGARVCRAAVADAQLPAVGPGRSALYALAAAALVLTGLMCCAPPTHYDSLVYHLALPRIYLMRHALVQVPYNLFSAFPQNMEMIFTAAMSIGGATAVRLMSFSCYLALLGLVHTIAARWAGARAGAYAACVIATFPSMMLLGSSAYVEVGLALFILAALLAVARWMETRDSRFLLAAGIVAGAAFGIKYYAGITIAGVSLILAAVLVRRPRDLISGPFIRAAGLFNSMALVLSAPWFVKNLIVFHNPVFPFFYRLFGWGGSGWNIESARGYFSAFVEYGAKTNLFRELLTLPMAITLNSQQFAGGADALGGIGWAYVMISLPAMLFIPRFIPPARVLYAYTVFHAVIWAATGQVLRFLIVILPALVIGVSAGMAALYERVGRVIRGGVIALGVAFCASNIFLFFLVNDVVEPFGVALGIESREAYLSRKLGAFYDCLRAANEQCDPRTDRVYIFGDQRGFYCDIPCEVTFSFAPERLVAAANAAIDGRALTRTLMDRGFTHVLFNRREARRLHRSYTILSFTPQGGRSWQEACAQWETLLDRTDAVLYRLRVPGSIPSCAPRARG